MNTSNTEISLFFSPEAKGRVKEGQPMFFLWRPDAVALFEEPTWFLYKRYVSRGATPSKHTWAAAAHDLQCWFQYLLAKKVDWHNAGEQEREMFADDYSVAISPRTGHEFSDKTINRRLSVIRAFYSFARERGWYRGDIGENVPTTCVKDIPTDADMLAHTTSMNDRVVEKDPLLRKVGRSNIVRPPQIAMLKKLLAAAGPSASDPQRDMRRIRDRIILDCGWVCGMRLNDVVQLTTLKFLGLTVESGQEFQDFSVIVEKSKGNVTRMVSVPGWLILDIQNYIQHEREKSIKVGGARAETGLFVGHADSKRAGKPITANAIQKMMAHACRKAGITEAVERVDHETGNRIQKIVPKHSYHDLRHICAVLTYHAEKARGNPEPWKVVQIKLGHKSVKVTLETYLAHVEVFGEKERVTDIRRLLWMNHEAERS